MDKVFIGVTWPYVNGDLHIGHVAGYLLPCDITARFFRLLGKQVLMVSGSDCYGTPITVAADKEGLSPQEIVNKYHKRDVELFMRLDVSYDLYTKTARRGHNEIVQDFLLAFWNKGLLEKQTRPQYFSPSLGRFLPDRYVEGECPQCGAKESRSDQCDNCGRLHEQDLINPISKIDNKKVELRDTEHLFIKWDKLQDKLESYYKKYSGSWRGWVRGETKKWLDEGLKPRAVTRDLDWGVKIPDDIARELDNASSKRVYVWFDAVIGYYSASVEWAEKTGGNWKDFWYDSSCKHYYFMGKDNLVFHTIFWPGQLMVYDEKLNLPDVVSINQYLTLGGKKFSKSRGVHVDTAEFIDKYGSDALRFYLTTIMPETADSSFTWEDFFRKNNGVLVGHLGNYIHRTLSLFKKVKLEGKVSKKCIVFSEQRLESAIKHITRSEFKGYYEDIEKLADFANKYFDELKPWEHKRGGADLVALTYVLACLLEPITPKASKNYLKMVGLGEDLLWRNAGKLDGHLKEVVGKIKISALEPLYQKYEK